MNRSTFKGLTPFSWHCPNCGKLVTGFENDMGEVKIECPQCRIFMIRRFKGRRTDTITMYPQRDQERLFKDF